MGEGQNVPAPTGSFSLPRTAIFQRRASFKVPFVTVRAIPRKEIHKGDFRCSAGCNTIDGGKQVNESKHQLRPAKQIFIY
jgi:hypothetical protein